MATVWFPIELAELTTTELGGTVIESFEGGIHVRGPIKCIEPYGQEGLRVEREYVEIEIGESWHRLPWFWSITGYVRNGHARLDSNGITFENFRGYHRILYGAPALQVA